MERGWGKITGVHFGATKDRKLIEKLDFEPVIQAIENKLVIWQIRVPSLVGECVAVKVFALSQLQFIASFVPTPEWAIKRIGKVIYILLWTGEDRIYIEKLTKARKKGGLPLPLLSNIVEA